MRTPERDPPRWSVSPGGEARPADGSAAGGEAFRREVPVELSDTALARIGRSVFAERQPARRSWFALRAAVVATVVLACTGGVVTAARLMWRPWRPDETQNLIVAAHNSVTVNRHHRRRLTLVGPATLALDPGARAGGADVVLENGTLTVEAGGESLLVSAGAVTVTVPADAAGEIRAAPDGAPTVRALSGVLQLHHDNGSNVTVSPEIHPEPTATKPPARPAPIAASAIGATAIAQTADVPAIAQPPQNGSIVRSRPAPVVAAAAPVFKPAPPAEPRPSASEAALLATVFRKLRSEKDAVSALDALDNYDRSYPSGWLRGEAAVARAEALLALGRSAEALPFLERAVSAGGTLTRNMRVTRGELLSKADRCDRAGEDFSEVLLVNQADTLAERALSGRAACAWRSGHADDARRDLRRYLELFPEGPRAEEARRLLTGRR
ncbi:MAG TPA: tetratricopeptide repeat protein [Polyangia bacterium]|jgi:hypothetical protein